MGSCQLRANGNAQCCNSLHMSGKEALWSANLIWANRLPDLFSHTFAGMFARVHVLCKDYAKCSAEPLLFCLLMFSTCVCLHPLCKRFRTKPLEVQAPRKTASESGKHSFRALPLGASTPTRVRLELRFLTVRQFDQRASTPQGSV